MVGVGVWMAEGCSFPLPSVIQADQSSLWTEWGRATDNRRFSRLCRIKNSSVLAGRASILRSSGGHLCILRPAKRLFTINDGWNPFIARKMNHRFKNFLTMSFVAGVLRFRQSLRSNIAIACCSRQAGLSWIGGGWRATEQ